MSLAAQWRDVQAGLPSSWSEARLLVRVADGATRRRALALLGPANAGARGEEIHVYCARGGAAASPDLVRRLLQRLDAEEIDGELELVSTGEAPATAATSRASLAESWDAALATLPPDWSDVYAEVDLDSTDYLERGALLLSPLNPARSSGRAQFRFRSARRFGYGVSPEMARRCFERLDADSLTGDVRILRALSDTRPVSTQGPVWYVEGRAV